MTDTDFESGDFSVDVATRTVRGLLLPYGRMNKPNASGNKPLKFTKGALRVPTDLAPLSVNRGHNRHDPVASFVSTEETEDGLFADFAISRDPEGDDFLEQYENGELRKLSAELGHIVRDPSDNTLALSAVLTGAAFVSAGSYEEAGLFAIAEPEPEPASAGPTTTVEKTTDEITGEDGVKHKRTTTTTTVVDGDKTTITEKTVIEEPEPPVDEKENTVGDALAPTNITPEKTENSLNSVFNLIAGGQKGDENALMALSDIKVTGTGALPVAGVIQPAWLGELYGKRSYARKYFPLIRQGTISAMEEKGFVVTGTEDLVKTWAGNKAELPSGSGSTELRTSILAKWGYAADIAQEFFLIPGNEEVISAFLNKIVNSYERVTDVWLAAQIAALANTNNIAAATYPTGYPAALGALIQGLEAVEDAGHTPTFVIANPAAWSQLLYTPKDQIPEFIKFGFGVQGEGNADGVRVVKGNMTGANLKPTSVVVGTSAAAHVNELAGASPVQLSALDIARGGVDKAVIGMTQFMADDPSGVIAVTPAA
jgi:hypothetical protein